MQCLVYHLKWKNILHLLLPQGFHCWEVPEVDNQENTSGLLLIHIAMSHDDPEHTTFLSCVPWAFRGTRAAKLCKASFLQTHPVCNRSCSVKCQQAAKLYIQILNTHQSPKGLCIVIAATIWVKHKKLQHFI